MTITDVVQEERMGLRHWTMILAICVVIDVSKYLDILTLEFLITLVHLPYSPGLQQMLHLRLVQRKLVALI